MSIEFEILDDLREVLSSKFDTTAQALADTSTRTKTFSITDFTTKPIDEQYFEQDNIGFVYLEKYDIAKVASTSNSVDMSLTFSIGVVFLSNSDNYMEQVILANSALSRVIASDELELNRYGNWITASLEPLDMTTQDNDNRYIFTGLELKIKIGLN